VFPRRDARDVHGIVYSKVYQRRSHNGDVAGEDVFVVYAEPSAAAVAPDKQIAGIRARHAVVL
jgi:hypothetical protein